MSNIDLENAVGNIFRIVFPSLEGASDKELLLMTSSEIEEWDSLTKVNLIAILEQDFNVLIDDEFAYNMSSFSQVVDYLEKSINAQ